MPELSCTNIGTCGRPLGGKVKFCPYCGELQPADIPKPVQPEPAAELPVAKPNVGEGETARTAPKVEPSAAPKPRKKTKAAPKSEPKPKTATKPKSDTKPKPRPKPKAAPKPKANPQPKAPEQTAPETQNKAASFEQNSPALSKTTAATHTPSADSAGIKSIAGKLKRLLIKAFKIVAFLFAFVVVGIVLLFVSHEDKDTSAKQQKQVSQNTPVSLYVKTTPSDALVRNLSITPKFQQGMKLNPGSYHLEISRPGYKTQKQWIKLAQGSNSFSFTLKKAPLLNISWTGLPEGSYIIRKNGTTIKPDNLRVPAGNYTIKLGAPGHYPKRVTIRPEKATTYRTSLTPLVCGQSESNTANGVTNVWWSVEKVKPDTFIAAVHNYFKSFVHLDKRNKAQRKIIKGKDVALLYYYPDKSKSSFILQAVSAEESAKGIHFLTQWKEKNGSWFSKVDKQNLAVNHLCKNIKLI